MWNCNQTSVVARGFAPYGETWRRFLLSLRSSCILISSTKLSLNSETTPRCLNSLVLLHVEYIPRKCGGRGYFRSNMYASLYYILLGKLLLDKGNSH